MNAMTTIPSAVRTQADLSTKALARTIDWLTPTPCIAARQSFAPSPAPAQSQHPAAGAGLYFKAENFQRTGSFKFRGALSKLTRLDVGTPVITASSGNHGLALAVAASITGHRLRIVLPQNVATDKHNKIKTLGVETILHSNDAGLAEEHAQEIAQERGLVYVSPYDDELIIAGQGTIALELLQQLPEIDTVFVSMGGGGLVSGIGSVLKVHSPNTRLVGVSATNSAALAASIRAGTVVQVDHTDTLADGCAGSVSEGSMTLPLASAVVDEMIECSEQEIADALRTIAWRENMLVEGSAALAYAAYRKYSQRQNDEKKPDETTSVVILCGANFDRSVVEPILSSPL